MKSGLRIGLISDTHMPGAIKELWPQVYQAFDGVDMVFHAGDLHTIEIVDRLSEIAPTYVAAGNVDIGLVDDRLKDHWCFELETLRVGAIHQFPAPSRKTPEQLMGYAKRYFHALPQVVIYGHTHMEGIHHVDNMLCINPGSMYEQGTLLGAIVQLGKNKIDNYVLTSG